MEYFNDIVDKKLSDKTKKNYGSRQIRFISWLSEKYGDVCFTNNNIVYNNITAAILHEYIGDESLFKEGTIKAGHMKSHSTIEGIHAALLQLFRKNNTPIPADFDEVLIFFFDVMKARFDCELICRNGVILILVTEKKSPRR
jgi:hypothetical protein